MKYIQVTENQMLQMLSNPDTEISGFEFTKMDFTELNLKSSLFLDCKFVSCNFANCSLMNVAFRGVVFEDCNLMGTNWTEVRKNGGYTFSGCKMDYTSFQGVDLRGSGFVNCMIRESDFAGANLSKVSLAGSSLAGTSFTNANIEKADFRGARDYFIDPKFTKIKDAHFSFPEALVLIEALGAKVEI